ncbi:MAG: UDP-3-O-acyl-N-acetylglucosamine deacetylase [Alphaproteobacteria bacterium]|uniref:UDP-3-O-acyl-N-acetylglucosamine deacetylase n=1 Tax=Candidatus Nitrobium versatile TaxID=2884831 RepID=A0A953M1Z1_9BACT|nr:UDP-3-O-acyl-N-acetylglucosamine deacetylase [Candidatus Nitrobium versatile]
MRLQRTIKKEIAFHGIGLHTGKQTAVRIKPAPRDTGVVFYRIDKGAIIKANVHSVIDTAFATTIGYEGVKIRTVEHLLAAAAGLGIDNLHIEVDGPEIPILDGSSMELTGMLLEAGIAKQGKRMPHIIITKPVSYEDSHARVVALPYEGTRISFSISFSHHLLGHQELTLDINEKSFVKEIAPARTFGFLRDVEMLRANGLAQGGSLENAIVVGDEGILNTSGLRFTDEFVRHKVLDTIGDMSLIGFPIQGHILLEKAGHTANLKFLKKLLLSPDCYRIHSEADHLNHQALNYR